MQKEYKGTHLLRDQVAKRGVVTSGNMGGTLIPQLHVTITTEQMAPSDIISTLSKAISLTFWLHFSTMEVNGGTLSLILSMVFTLEVSQKSCSLTSQNC